MPVSPDAYTFGFANHPATADDVARIGRWIFLGRVAKVAPQVLHELVKVPEIPLYGLEDMRQSGTVGAIDEVSLAAWARRWNLTEPWCLAYARATWQDYIFYRDVKRIWQERGPFWIDGEVSGSIEAGPVDVRWRKVRGQWQPIHRVYDPFDANVKPARIPRKARAHVDWLVKFHVTGQPYRTLAGKERNDKAVRLACQQLAKQIGLTLRKPTRGRPRERYAR